MSRGPIRQPAPLGFDAVAEWLATMSPERALAVLDAAQGKVPAPAAAPEVPVVPADGRPVIRRDDTRGFLANLEQIARGDTLVG